MNSRPALPPNAVEDATGRNVWFVFTHPTDDDQYRKFYSAEAAQTFIATMDTQGIRVWC